ncbi:hypothetical protein [Cellulosimicrobium cellulans]|uniref:hypothetical protein n=1 Tax=Cellulosimicrobium cellulans TaxID=1710 RepID=UPI0020CF00D8|nr:hypothetical protein NMQ07_04150 [Cellulosimicrobium cellulans]
MTAAKTPLSREELSSRFPDPDWHVRLLEILALVDILRDSIIRKDYRVSDELNDAIRLSPEGKQVRDRMATNRDYKVNPKIANLLTLITTLHVDPLVDVDRLDIDALASVIGGEIRDRKILLAHRMGRTLYDRAADLFPEERTFLRHEETLRLLNSSPQGIYHTERFLTGPLGLIITDHRRRIPPATRIPLQHCPDRSCVSVHRVQLSTSVEAEVNRDRPHLNRVLDEISLEPSDWSGFLSDSLENRRNIFDDSSPDTLPFLLAEALSERELRTLFAVALDSGSTLRELCSTFGRDGKADQITAAFGSAEILQLLLTITDSQLLELLNAAVRDGSILVPEGETRRLRVNTNSSTGAWHLRPQLGNRGFRLVNRSVELPLLRLSALCREAFIESGSIGAAEDLEWLLRNTPGENVLERLEKFVRTASPREVVEHLFLSHRNLADLLRTKIGASLEESDEVIIETTLWRLGFSLDARPDQRDTFWRLHQAVERSARSASVSSVVDEEAIRSVASNYFVSLERFLADTLHFATWALLYDHFSSDEPFTYYEIDGHQFAMETLTAASKILDSEPFSLGKDPDLFTLVRSISLLGRHLDSINKSRDEHLRASEAFPKYATRTNLQRFPFTHAYPYLDLTEQSRNALPKVLKDASRIVNDSGILPMRNSLLHARRSSIQMTQLVEALASAQTGLLLLENAGLTLSTFSLDVRSSDRWGRSTIKQRNRDGEEVSYAEPNAFGWAGMPGMNGAQLVVRSALIAPPSVVLRFRLGRDSEYRRMWADFPKRRKRGSRVGSLGTDAGALSQSTGSFLSPPAD